MLRFFSNLSIRNKILTVNAVTLLFLFIVSGVTVYSLNQVYEQARIMSERRMPNMLLVNNIQKKFLDALLRLNMVLLSTTLADGEKVWKEQYLPLHEELNQEQKTYEERMSAAAKETYNKFQNIRIAYISKIGQVHDLYLAGKTEESKATLRNTRNEFKTMQTLLDDIIKLDKNIVSQSVSEAKSMFEHALEISLGLATLSLSKRQVPVTPARVSLSSPTK